MTNKPLQKFCHFITNENSPKVWLFLSKLWARDRVCQHFMDSLAKVVRYRNIHQVIPILKTAAPAVRLVDAFVSAKLRVAQPGCQRAIAVKYFAVVEHRAANVIQIIGKQEPPPSFKTKSKLAMDKLNARPKGQVELCAAVWLPKAWQALPLRTQRLQFHQVAIELGLGVEMV